GESGIANSGTISGFTWGTMFKAIYDDLLADLGLPANSIPIIAGQTYGGRGPTSTGGAGNTDGALASEEALRTATGLPNVHLISSDGLSGRTNNAGQYDYTHFSAAGIRGLGLNYANKMIELVYSP
ncbi:MAG: sialate O-acetylesterase, partial [Treponema sp.]|nr:sialate O-acetylesterase [Treponema sp.]